MPPLTLATRVVYLRGSGHSGIFRGMHAVTRAVADHFGLGVPVFEHAGNQLTVVIPVPGSDPIKVGPLVMTAQLAQALDEMTAS